MDILGSFVWAVGAASAGKIVELTTPYRNFEHIALNVPDKMQRSSLWRQSSLLKSSLFQQEILRGPGLRAGG
jgi:hypothetical protein